jgi:hypothetical protein
MGYRKLVVGDKTYEYVIGKTHTKVKGVGVFLNSSYGVSVVRPAMLSKTEQKKWFVSPGMLADKLSGKPIRAIEDTPSMQSCDDHGVHTVFRVADPYMIEVCRVYRGMIACKKCYDQRSWDI